MELGPSRISIILSSLDLKVTIKGDQISARKCLTYIFLDLNFALYLGRKPEVMQDCINQTSPQKNEQNSEMKIDNLINQEQGTIEIDQVQEKILGSEGVVLDKILTKEGQSSRSLPDLEPHLGFELMEEELTCRGPFFDLRLR